MRNSFSVGIFNDQEESFSGGGEQTVKDIYEFLNRMNITVQLFYPDKLGVCSVNGDHKGKSQTGREESIYEHFGRPQFLYHALPKPSVLSKSMINLIMVHRIPPLRYIRILSSGSTKSILLFHGIGIEDLRLTSLVIILYQIYLRVQIRRIVSILRSSNNIHIQVLTDKAKAKMEKIGVPAKLIHVIHSGINVDLYRVRNNSSEFRVVFIGRIENTQKGIKRLISVARNVNKLEKSISFDVCGSGPERKLLQQCGLRNIIYHGYVDETHKLEILSKGNLSISTSNMEGFSLVILEGLYSGLPVVSTDCLGPSTIVNSDPLFGKIESFSPKSIASSIIEYYKYWKDNTTAYYADKEKRSIKSKELFNLDRMGRDYLSMSEEVCLANGSS